MKLKNIKNIVPALALVILIGFGLYAYGTSKSKDITFDKEQTEKSFEAAKTWFVNNLQPEGKFTYVYNPQTNTYSNNNNMIRQLMASRLLGELSEKDESLKKLNRQNLDYVLRNWYQEKDGRGYIYFDSKSKLGANAMALRALVYSPHYEDYKEKAEKLAQGILHLQNEDGSFKAWYIAPNYGYDKDYLLSFYSGEAILALVEYYEKTGREEILKAAVKSQDFYIKKYVEELKENYYPAYVPWHTQSLNKLYKITKNEIYGRAIFTLNNELLKIQDLKGRKTLGRFYDPKYPQYGTPHSASDGVYTEGLAYAYEIAEILKNQQHMNKYKDALNLGIHNLTNLQFTKENAVRFKEPEKVIGAIPYRYDDHRVRVDNVQHMMDAYLKIFELAESLTE